jgi:LemA protein
MIDKRQIICVVLLILVIVSVGFAATIILTYNDLVASRLQAENKWASVRVQFERKVDLIPQLVEVVENYTEYEQETLALLVELRTQWLNSNGSPSVQANISTQIDTAIQSLFVAIAENYPDLEADTLYIGLFDEITGTENRITMAKLDYNDAVTAYNTKLAMFPGNWIGGMFGMIPMELYSPS